MNIKSVISMQKLKYICKLVTTTPNFGLIIVLQVLSGFLNVAGIPMLIPVLEYARADIVTNSNAAEFILINRIFDFLGFEPTFKSVLFLASLLIVSGQLLVFFSTIIANFSQLELSQEYRKKIFRYYNKVDWLWLTRDRSGEMNNAILKEADIAGVAHLNSQRIVIYFIQVVALLFIVIKISFFATMLAFGLYSVLLLVNSINSEHVRRLSEKFIDTFKILASATANLQQNKKFFKSSFLYKGIQQKLFAYVNETVRVRKLVALREGLQDSWTFLATLFFIVFLMGFHEMLHLGFSELLVVLLVFMRIGPQFNALFTAYLSLNANIPGHRSIEKRIKGLQENQEKFGDKIFKYTDTIFFNEVNFKYPDGEKVVNRSSFEVKPFQSVAFVGSSGGGKTTILDLFLGLLKPDSGMIYYGDIPHYELDVKEFRKKIAYVSQETTLLDGTFLDNLTVGYPNAPYDVIKDICKRVQLDSLISNLPDGIHTEIGENGIKLSGGQRQRVALGRALLIKPSILILDEATSELDTETELLIQEEIKNLSQTMTIIMVAHRLSTVKLCDIIYVIENGSICETGRYDELLEKRSRLYYLDSLQKDASLLTK